MAIVKPFRALYYNIDNISDVSEVTAPPYDVISPEQQAELYDRHEHNIIRLILNRPTVADSETDNVYLRAAATLEAWRSSGVLVKDRFPCFYMYELEFRFKGQNRKVRGFITRVKLEDLEQGSILAHEKTLSRPKTDRLELLTACKTNLSQIYGLYSDTKKTADKIFEKTAKSAPLLEAQSEDGVRHRIFRITNKDDLERLIAMMKDKSVFIADGHHRYETALLYRDQQARERHLASGDPVNFVMMMLVNMASEQLIILPTHRLLRGLVSSNPRLFKNRVEPYFDFLPIECREDCQKTLLRKLRAQPSTAFGIYFGNGRCFLLRSKDRSAIESMIDPTYSASWRQLDVTILHEALIENLLGFSSLELEPKSLINYVKDSSEAFRRVDDHEYQVAFLLNPTRIEQLKEVATNRERMPQKSTHFFPKLRSGLLLNPLE